MFIRQKLKNKRLALIMMAFLLLMTIFPAQSLVASTPLTVSFSSPSGQVGETISIDLKLGNVTENAEVGICTSNLTINYDNTILQLVSITRGSIIPADATFSSNPTNADITNKNANPGQIVFVNNDSTQAENLITNDGTYATIVFKINEDPANGITPITFSSVGTDNSFTKILEDLLLPDDILGFELIPGSITVESPIPPAPAAPTAPVQDDENNTFGWTNVEGYTEASDYEYSVDGGTTWVTCTANPQSLPNEAYAIGDVKVRVKADGSTQRPAGEILSSTAAYTVNVVIPPAPAAPTAPVQDDENNTFGWTNVEGYTEASDYEYSVDGGTTWVTCTANPQSLPNEAYAIG
ncbi:MAG: hypothetical protein JL50_19485, partial [Peptococcaceae bacterium BICA1-7]